MANLMGKTLEQLSSEDIEFLVDNSVPESLIHDYKQELNLAEKKEKERFLNNITSFANSEGGFLLIGIAEKRDAKGKSTGTGKLLGVGDLNVDETVKTVNNLCQTLVDPYLVPKFKQLEVREKNILIIAVDKSFSGPHMVKSNSRYYKRHSSGRYQMDTQDLRRAFNERDIWETRAEEFVQQRLGKIYECEGVNKEGWGRGIYLCHLLPLGRLRETIDVKEMLRDISFIDTIGANKRYNIDGPFYFQNYEDDHQCIQVFRNGGIEISWKGCVKSHNGSDLIHGSDFARFINNTLNNAFEIIGKTNIRPPFGLYISLNDVFGVCLALDRSFTQKFDRENIVIPPRIVESYPEGIEEFMKPTYDVLCQAAGYSENKCYDKNGNWIIK